MLKGPASMRSLEERLFGYEPDLFPYEELRDPAQWDGPSYISKRAKGAQ